MTREELKEKWNTTKYKKISLYIPFHDANTGELVQTAEEGTLEYVLDNMSYANEQTWFIYKCVKSGEPFTITERVLKEFEEKGYLKIIE